MIWQTRFILTLCTKYVQNISIYITWTRHLLLQLGATTTELSLVEDISLDKVITVLGSFVSRDVLFEPVIARFVWKSRSPISGNWFKMLPMSCKMFSHWSLLMLSSNMGRVWNGYRYIDKGWKESLPFKSEGSNAGI